MTERKVKKTWIFTYEEELHSLYCLEKIIAEQYRSPVSSGQGKEHGRTDEVSCKDTLDVKA